MARHERIPLSRSFGPLRRVLRSPASLLYAHAFAPLVPAGPWVRAGDQIVVSARKRPGRSG